MSPSDERPRALAGTLDLPDGGFFPKWAKEPERFAEFLPDPFPPDAAIQAAERALRLERPREAVATALVEANRRWGADRKALASAARLRDPASVAIVTGQQPGLLGGPLYGLAKAISAAAAARQFQEQTGREAIPVFWVEGDDHDFEEVRSTWLLDADGQPAMLRYQPDEEAPGLPGSARKLDRNITTLLDEFAARLPPSEFAADALAAARDAYAPGRTLAEAFCRLLAWCSRGTGLVVMDPSDPALKRLALPVYQKALDIQEEARRRVAARTAGCVAAGFPAQASPTGYGVFRTGDDGRRVRLEPPGPESADQPERLSAAVLLRPLIQDFLLPTAAYVAGPSEMAYHAQIGDLYDLHRIPRPLVLPRHLVAVLQPANLRVLQEDGIPFDELAASDEAALNRRAGDAASVEALAAAQAATVERLQDVEAALGALDASLAGAVARARGRMLRVLQDLEGKALRAAKRRDGERRQRFLRARNALFPGGRPQERRLGPLVFFARYGPGFVERLDAALGDPAASRLRRNLIVP